MSPLAVALSLFGIACCTAIGGWSAGRYYKTRRFDYQASAIVFLLILIALLGVLVVGYLEAVVGTLPVVVLGVMAAALLGCFSPLLATQSFYSKSLHLAHKRVIFWHLSLDEREVVRRMFEAFKHNQPFPTAAIELYVKIADALGEKIVIDNKRYLIEYNTATNVIYLQKFH